MPRDINLRQIEALKAVIECGTVSHAAEVLHVSQPAVSKLLAHLEEDTGLTLFERVKGRLVPSRHGIRLYEEVERIFAGIGQVQRAVDLIKREERGHISIGVLPAFSGLFVSRATQYFLKAHGDAHVSVTARSSQFIAEWLLSRHIDIGILNSDLDHPLVESTSLGSGYLVCVAPKDHPLAASETVTAQQLAGLPFLGFSTENRTRHRIDTVLNGEGVRVNHVIDANLSSAICEMVADGMGVSLLDPLFAYGQKERLTIRPFKPDIVSDLRVCRLKSPVNPRLTDAYADAVQRTALELLETMRPGV